jgi:uncharacterized protein (DUF2147 family)
VAADSGNGLSSVLDFERYLAESMAAGSRERISARPHHSGICHLKRNLCMSLKALALALTFAALAGSTAEAASPAVGLWAAPEHGVIVKMEACGDALCGYLVTSDLIAANPDQVDAHNQDASLRSRRLKGLALLNDLKGGPTEWHGGAIYDIESGKTHPASVKLNSPNSMTLTGCLVAFICKSQTWTRVKH